MKTLTIVLIILLAAGLTSSRAQDTWTQKADFGGIAREAAVGFSIGDKGYIGTGYNNGTLYKDFWEYDAATDVWTQKADYGGNATYGEAGFAIGSKGYVGTGNNGGFGFYKDFWEYDPTSNTWTQKADFAGPARYATVSFSIGNKGYIGTGFNWGIHGDSATNLKDFWEYDPIADSWAKKADFGGGVCAWASGFNIGTNGYIGTGIVGDPFGGIRTNQFYEYDPATDTWTKKANFGGTARDGAAGFSIGGKGYIGTGYDGSYKNDFWEYDPALNTWIQKANFGGTSRVRAKGFPIGNKAYCGTGNDGSEKKDFWEYTPDCSGGITVYLDADADGYGDLSNSLFVADCVAPSGYVYNSNDCNDANATVHPGACDASNGNSIDDNCDGIIDNGFGTTTYYADVDGDGYGAGTGTSLCSNPGLGYSINNTDCNDNNAAINPNAIEIINGIDDNCNGIIDDVICGIPSELTTANITGTSAKLKWDAVADALRYKVRYKEAGTSEWSKITDVKSNSKNISGLAPNTFYYWEVKSVCSANPVVSSDWSAKSSFTTGAFKLGDESEISLELYPNPVTESFTLDLQLATTTDQSVIIFVLNSIGQTVYTSHELTGNGELQKVITMPSTATTGWYVVRVMMNDQVMEKKLMYQK